VERCCIPTSERRKALAIGQQESRGIVFIDSRTNSRDAGRHCRSQDSQGFNDHATERDDFIEASAQSNVFTVPSALGDARLQLGAPNERTTCKLDDESGTRLGTVRVGDRLLVP